MKAELEHHLEEERSEPAENATPRNRRNGHSKKTIKGEFGEAEIAVPRNRNSDFEPVIVQKGQTRFDGFDGKILSLYSRGMSVRDIQAQLQDLYGVEVSAGLISARYWCGWRGAQALAESLAGMSIGLCQESKLGRKSLFVNECKTV